MPRLKIYFGYDGTRYHGWQRQKNSPLTVQEVFEAKLSQIAASRIHITASGRTDAGVHARIQVAHAEIPSALFHRYARATGPGAFVLEGLQYALNGLLPRDVRVYRIEAASDQFDSGRVAKKTYVYFIDPNSVQAPMLKDHAWHLRLPLDWRAMAEAAKAFPGHHDFKGFCASDTDVKTTDRTVFEAWWGETGDLGMGLGSLMAFRITGAGFLKHMVRSIVGTLVHIGMGRAKPDLVPRILETGERKLVGATAPAHGLWLWDILYLTRGVSLD